MSSPGDAKTVEPDLGGRRTPAFSRAIHIGVIGVNFKTAPIATRERLARKITLERLSELRNTELKKHPTELVLLSTCNRIEVYFASEAFERVMKTLRFLFQLDGEETDYQTYELSDRRAVEHLFGVSSGLDSLVIGEAQILTQVREECKSAQQAGVCNSILSKLFAKAYNTGKEIRESYPRFTNGFKNSISLSVVDLISKRGNKPNLLLVGAGKMIRLAVSSFDRSQFGKIVVAARKNTLKDIEADKIVQISEFGKTLVEEEIEVVITATSSLDYIVTPRDLERFAREARKGTLLIVDISVPRNVDPEVVKVAPGISLLNIDDLKEKVTEAGKESAKSPDMMDQLRDIQSSISSRSGEFISWMMENSSLFPIMTALRRKAEGIRSNELDNAFARLSNIGPEQREVISRMSERIVRRLLADPTERLRELTRNGEQERAEQYGSVLKDIFSIEAPLGDESGSEKSAQA